MEILKRYIEGKEAINNYKTPINNNKINNCNIINKNDLQITFLKEKNEKEINNNVLNKIYPYIQDENEKLYYFSRKLNSNVLFLVNNKNAIEFIYKELIYSKAKKEYRNRILKLFKEYFAYCEETKFELIKKYDFESKKIYFSLERIKISDVYEFFDNKYNNNSKNKSLNYILSRIRKYIRLINDEPNLNYNKKIEFKNKNRKEVLSSLEQILFIKYLKEKNDLQILLLFYFLYYLGFTFSKVSRIRITDFKNSLNTLNIKKGKLQRYKIIPVIVENIYEFIKVKPNKSKYLFYDFFLDSKMLSRVNYIKDKFITSFRSSHLFSLEKEKLLIKNLIKTRSPKRISNSFKFVFDKSIEISNNFINSELSDFNQLNENSISINEKDSSENPEGFFNDNFSNIWQQENHPNKGLIEKKKFNEESENKESNFNKSDSLDSFEKREYKFLNNEVYFY